MTTTHSFTKGSELFGLKAADPKPGQIYPYVAKIVEACPAFGVIEINSQIISVNGTSMENQPYKTVHEAVRDTHVGDVITFEVKRPAQAMGLQFAPGAIVDIDMNSCDVEQDAC